MKELRSQGNRTKLVKDRLYVNGKLYRTENHVNFGVQNQANRIPKAGSQAQLVGVQTTQLQLQQRDAVARPMETNVWPMDRHLRPTETQVRARETHSVFENKNESNNIDDSVEQHSASCYEELDTRISELEVEKAILKLTCNKKDTIVSVTVGSVIGGLILGIVLTVLGLIIYQNIRNGKPKAEKKKWPKAAVFNNTTFETERDADQNIPTVQRINERKVVNVPPFAHSIDLPVKKNIQDAKQRSMANSDVNNGVYNHLHEKEEDLDIDENYDHAHGNNNRAMEESDYSNLNTGRR
ncbi:uncharacterized protein LOC133176575 [Saccostrea echinata]|uniref:uncharacterized protein LOC133176575 n=1 Tax=Saccostrea echinata TaxID=191078 RepID=UPI002A836519|nr:uncharacterized protein LOC133176575 [Saccostrea echinata]